MGEQQNETMSVSHGGLTPEVTKDSIKSFLEDLKEEEKYAKDLLEHIKEEEAYVKNLLDNMDAPTSSIADPKREAAVEETPLQAQGVNAIAPFLKEEEKYAKDLLENIKEEEVYVKNLLDKMEIGAVPTSCTDQPKREAAAEDAKLKPEGINAIAPKTEFSNEVKSKEATDDRLNETFDTASTETPSSASSAYFSLVKEDNLSKSTEEDTDLKSLEHGEGNNELTASAANVFEEEICSVEVDLIEGAIDMDSRTVISVVSEGVSQKHEPMDVEGSVREDQSRRSVKSIRSMRSMRSTRSSRSMRSTKSTRSASMRVMSTLMSASKANDDEGSNRDDQSKKSARSASVKHLSSIKTFLSESKDAEGMARDDRSKKSSKATSRKTSASKGWVKNENLQEYATIEQQADKMTPPPEMILMKPSSERPMNFEMGSSSTVSSLYTTGRDASTLTASYVEAKAENETPIETETRRFIRPDGTSVTLQVAKSTKIVDRYPKPSEEIEHYETYDEYFPSGESIGHSTLTSLTKDSHFPDDPEAPSPEKRLDGDVSQLTPPEEWHVYERPGNGNAATYMSQLKGTDDDTQDYSESFTFREFLKIASTDKTVRTLVTSAICLAVILVVMVVVIFVISSRRALD